MDSENSPEEASEKIPSPSFATVMYQRFVAHITGNQQRTGQAWMNALAEVDPDLYREIHGTDADCFYNDRKVAAFKARVFGGE